MKSSNTTIETARQAILDGDLVAFPTETVYGLGANALNSNAVLKIYETKERPYFNPLIVHIAQISQLTTYVEVSPIAQKLAEHFWPGPLTLVLPKKELIPDIVTAGLPTVGIRIPNHPVALELLRSVNVPIAGPSANRFGKMSPTTADAVWDTLHGKLKYVLDGGACAVGVESTILYFAGDEVLLLRPGGIPVDEIEAFLGTKLSRRAITKTLAPGMLKQHYSPNTPFTLLSEAEEIPSADDIGVLSFGQNVSSIRVGAVEELSTTKDLKEAARNLFSSLRSLDRRGLRKIYAKRFPEVGLGIALNDRLERASH